ncbi:hypothetical protein K438DRAFT_2131355 [Mycena galopus ATCC 62051]|nr:hypothetical protein K438DRAFT_2131355 [Mycena galopus ATCC 62051]
MEKKGERTWKRDKRGRMSATSKGNLTETCGARSRLAQTKTQRQKRPVEATEGRAATRARSRALFPPIRRRGKETAALGVAAEKDPADSDIGLSKREAKKGQGSSEKMRHSQRKPDQTLDQTKKTPICPCTLGRKMRFSERESESANANAGNARPDSDTLLAAALLGLAFCTLDPSGHFKGQASRVRGWRTLRHAMQTRSSRPPADPVARKTRTVKAHSVPRKAALVWHGAMHEKWCHASEEHKRRGGGEVPARVERAGREGRMPGKATQLLVTIRGRFGLKDPSSGMRTHSASKRTRGAVEVLVEVDIEGEAMEEEVDNEVEVARDGERVIEPEPEKGENERKGERRNGGTNGTIYVMLMASPDSGIPKLLAPNLNRNHHACAYKAAALPPRSLLCSTGSATRARMTAELLHFSRGDYLQTAPFGPALHVRRVCKFRHPYAHAETVFWPSGYD